MARILIIDDEPAMVDVISTLCRDKGHQAFPYSSAQKAIDAMPEISPQIVISDIQISPAKVLIHCENSLTSISNGGPIHLP